METTTLFFLLGHIGALKNLAIGQWVTILGAAVSAFGMSLAANPHEMGVAVGAAAGTAIVAIVHVLQPSPVPPKEPARVIGRIDPQGRTHL